MEKSDRDTDMSSRRATVLTVLAICLLAGIGAAYLLLMTGWGWTNAGGVFAVSLILFIPTAVVAWFAE